jgi:FkbM family methyltransferase
MNIVRSIKDWSYPARERMASAIFPAGRRLAQGGKVSYSGAGEDLIVLAWLTRSGADPSTLRYLDVGAADPVELSNTYLLWTYGARGVLVEPDPEQAEKLKTRTGDIVLNVGAAFDESVSATLVRFETRFFNTMLAERAAVTERQSQSWDAPQAIVDKIEVPLVSINRIIEAHFGGAAPDFLSIDAEGIDFAILRSLDLSRFNPSVICIEACTSLEEFESLLSPHHYHLIAHTPDNFIFWRAIL